MAKGKVEKLKKAIYSEVPKVDLAPFGMKLFIFRPIIIIININYLYSYMLKENKSYLFKTW